MRKTMTTFPSEGDWEECDRRMRTACWMRVQAMRLAIMTVMALLLFGLVYFFASHASPRRYDAWGAMCEASIRERNGNGN